MQIADTFLAKLILWYTKNKICTLYLYKAPTTFHLSIMVTKYDISQQVCGLQRLLQT